MRYDGSISVKEIANWINRSESFVRGAMENGSLDIGGYVRNGSRGTYYISPKLAWERTGYRRNEEDTDGYSTLPHDGCNTSGGS